MSEDKFKKYSEIVNEMQAIYSKGKICDFKDRSKCDLALEPEITNILTQSTNPEELKYVWDEWRKVSGKKVRKLFEDYVELSNEAARSNSK